MKIAKEMCCAQNIVDNSFELFDELTEMIMADEGLQSPDDGPNE